MNRVIFVTTLSAVSRINFEWHVFNCGGKLNAQKKQSSKPQVAGHHSYLNKLPESSCYGWRKKEHPGKT